MCCKLCSYNKLEKRNVIKKTYKESMFTVFTEETSMYKWTHAIQMCVVQGRLYLVWYMLIP